MEIGIYTFAEITPDPLTGKTISTHQRIRNLMEEIELAEQVGLDVFAVGEHHRPDFAVSSPAVILAAAAIKTKKIKLSSAVTVLSSDDPVRVFQDFATVDHLSDGRAEIMAGRGSFIESFPLFGYDLDDYDELFAEKLELLVQLNEKEKISWKGKHRPPINNLGVYPRPYQDKLPIWVAVGGTPESVIRAGKYGLPMALAIIGGMPSRFAPLTQLYRNSARKAGHAVEQLQLGINSHAYIADTSQKAADEFYPPYADVMTRLGKERGWSPMDREHF
ncbi:MAG: LLM class flavin-dependent oxidoreductase, partial [Bacteroidetes bacterium]